jgi:hypothetical protein
MFTFILFVFRIHKSHFQYSDSEILRETSKNSTDHVLADFSQTCELQNFNLQIQLGVGMKFGLFASTNKYPIMHPKFTHTTHASVIHLCWDMHLCPVQIYCITHC